jgi:hypothetical protein
MLPVIKWFVVACACVNRKHSDVTEDTPAEGSPVKRRRPADPNSYCHKCSCRLELAVQAMGKCKCGKCDISPLVLIVLLVEISLRLEQYLPPVDAHT